MLRTSEVAKRLGISESSVRSLCDSGVLSTIRPMGEKGHRRIDPNSLEDYIQQLKFKETVYVGPYENDPWEIAIRKATG